MEYKKNDCVTVTIEDIGNDGEGIGRVEGFTLFVKDAVPGDTVEARIVKNKKSYAYARLEKVLVPSPFRVEPSCPCHRQCGGCQLQGLSYEKQLSFKQDKIRNSLIRIGGFAPEYMDERMEPIVGMEHPFRYRNKAQYPVGADREGKIIAGFYAGRTHSIIANTDCMLGPEENGEILKCILRYMRENKVSAYDETSGEGIVRHVLIRKGFMSGEIMVCLVINRKPGDGKNVTEVSEKAKKAEKTELSAIIPAQDKLLRELRKIKGMTSVSVNINTERTNVIMGKEVHTIWGSDTITDRIRVRDMTKEGYPFTGKELTFEISPMSFYQVNPAQTEKLYSLALEYAGLTGRETVWDLYCGIGTISLFLAGNAGKVCGVEIVPQAVKDAKKNAERNGITNAEFFVGKAEEVLRETGDTVMQERENAGLQKSGDTVAQESENAGLRESGDAVLQESENAGERKGGDTVAQESENAGERESGDAVLQENESAGERESGDAVRQESENAGERKGGKAAAGRTDFGRLPAPDVIIVDPPRKGCDPACVEVMLKMQPEKIVYISCDPATLARDLKALCAGGYELKRVRGVDQFGMTVHVECVVLMSRVTK